MLGAGGRWGHPFLSLFHPFHSPIDKSCIRQLPVTSSLNFLPEKSEMGFRNHLLDFFPPL